MLEFLIFNIFLFKKILKFILRQKGRAGGEGEGKKHQCVVALTHPLLGTWATTQVCALTGN